MHSCFLLYLHSSQAHKTLTSSLKLSSIGVVIVVNVETMLIKTFLGHCYYIDAQTHEDIVEAVKTLEGLPDCVCLRCEKDGKPLLENGSLDGTDCVTVTLAGGLPGGKGGFEQAARQKVFLPNDSEIREGAGGPKIQGG